MGTGKTTVGNLLAKSKRWKFLDLDDFIQLRQKRLIADIFAKEGEVYFRRIEKEALKEVAKEKNFVVSCGGGIVLDKANIAIMKETGKVICLCASPSVILKRVSGNKDRPLLNVPDPKARIKELLASRAKYYALAHKTVDTSKLSVEQVAQKIIKATKSQVKKHKRRIKNVKRKAIA